MLIMSKSEKVISIIETVCDKETYDSNDIAMLKTLNDVLSLTIKMDLIENDRDFAPREELEKEIIKLRAKEKAQLKANKKKTPRS